ncbi:MAG: zf-HC2 domain-containing protein [Armatimonadetes bacterium]|nr:zf-HC2 domain-containing protein [Armatimonadota bacterium]MDW8028032.1 zf-HC2 domain-containing protein [Armatimonadota bacterium]
MNCHQWSEQLSAWIDGMLTESEREALEEHLKDCKICQQTANEFFELKRKLREMPIPSPKPKMWNRVMGHVRYRTSRRRFTFIKPSFWLASVASIALMFSVIALFWQKQKTFGSEEPTVNFIVGYHADTVSLGLSDNPLCHLIATAELSEAEGYE